MKHLLSQLLVMVVLAFYACSSPQPYDYGTESDSARYYFQLGWQEILDNGRWTESEATFRKAVELDPEWLLGKSLVGRITRDAAEKQQLLKDLQLNMTQAGPDERKLLEVNMLSIAASVNRDRGTSNTAEFNKIRREIAEKNFGAFARKYPEDNYFKAEYIEFLHANHGAQTALDSNGEHTCSQGADAYFRHDPRRDGRRRATHTTRTPTHTTRRTGAQTAAWCVSRRDACAPRASPPRGPLKVDNYL